MLAWHLSSEKVGRRVGVKGLMVLIDSGQERIGVQGLRGNGTGS